LGLGRNRRAEVPLDGVQPGGGDRSNHLFGIMADEVQGDRYAEQLIGMVDTLADVKCQSQQAVGCPGRGE
jgi:hypothetical protein